MCDSVWILEPWNYIDDISIMGCILYDVTEGPAVKSTGRHLYPVCHKREGPPRRVPPSVWAWFHSRFLWLKGSFKREIKKNLGVGGQNSLTRFGFGFERSLRACGSFGHNLGRSFGGNAGIKEILQTEVCPEQQQHLNCVQLLWKVCL